MQLWGKRFLSLPRRLTNSPAHFPTFPLSPLLWLLPAALAGDPSRILDERIYHLGQPGQPEWQQFEGKTPDGTRLDVRFAAQANTREATLFLRQDDVKLEWAIELNGHRLGKLFLMEAPLVYALSVPPATVR